MSRPLPVLGSGPAPAHSAGAAAAHRPDAAAHPTGARAVDLARAPAEAPRPAATAPLWAALEEVNDPELPISVVDLGLVYDIRRDTTTAGSARVTVDLTFTAMGCPCVDFIRQDVRERLLQEPTVDEVFIREVWSPAWSRARMSARGRQQMTRFGVSV